MFHIRSALCVCVVLGLAACAAPLPENTVPLNRAVESKSKSKVKARLSKPPVMITPVAQQAGLQAGAKIIVTVTDEDDLSGTYTLNERGIATMPLIGDVNLTGLDAEGARDYIGAQYKDGYLTAPEIALEIIDMGAQSL